jgi:hypothetical protein
MHPPSPDRCPCRRRRSDGAHDGSEQRCPDRQPRRASSRADSDRSGIGALASSGRSGIVLRRAGPERRSKLRWEAASDCARARGRGSGIGMRQISNIVNRSLMLAIEKPPAALWVLQMDFSGVPLLPNSNHLPAEIRVVVPMCRDRANQCLYDWLNIHAAGSGRFRCDAQRRHFGLIRCAGVPALGRRHVRFPRSSIDGPGTRRGLPVTRRIAIRFEPDRCGAASGVSSRTHSTTSTHPYAYAGRIDGLGRRDVVHITRILSR